MAAPDPWLNRTVDGLRLERRIAIGGFGTVYRATDAVGNVEAVKIFADPKAAELLRHEIAHVSLIRHPAIVTPVGWGTVPHPTSTETAGWLRMPWAAEGDLTQWSPPTDRAAVAAVLRLLGALAKAHAAGLVHGDVKAANLLNFGNDELGTPDVRLSDFGIALRFRITPEYSAVTPWGTPNQRSPEQERGSLRDAGPWTDLYCLGVVLARWRITFAGWKEWLSGLLHLDPAARYPTARAASDALLPSLSFDNFGALVTRMGLGHRPMAVAMASPRQDSTPLPFQTGERARFIQQACAWVTAQRRVGDAGWLHLEGPPGYGRTSALQAATGLLGTLPDLRVLEADARAPLTSLPLQALRHWLRVDGLEKWEARARLHRWRSALGLQDDTALKAVERALLSDITPETTTSQRLQAGRQAVAALAKLCRAGDTVLLVDNVVPDTSAWRELMYLRETASTSGLVIVSTGGPTYDTEGPTATLALPPVSDHEADRWLHQVGMTEKALRDRVVAWGGGDPRQLSLLPADPSWPFRHGANLERRLRELNVHDPPVLTSTAYPAATVICGLGPQWTADLHAIVLHCLSGSDLPDVLATRLVVSRQEARWRRDADRLSVQQHLCGLERVQRAGLATQVRELATRLPQSRAALLHWAAVLEDDALEAARHALALARSWFEDGARQRALAVLEEAAVRLARETPPQDAVWLEVSLFRVNLQRLSGDVDGAERTLNEAMTRVDQRTSARVRGVATLALANIAAARHDIGTTRRMAELACALLDEAKEVRLRGHALHTLGAACRRENDKETAASALRRAYADLVDTDPYAALTCRLTLAHVDAMQEHFEEALAGYDDVIATAETQGYPSEEALARNARGDVLRRMGSFPDALAEYSQALALVRSLGATEHERTVLFNLTLTALATGTLAQAAHWLAALTTLPASTGIYADWLLVLRAVMAHASDAPDAASLLRAWQELAEAGTLRIAVDDPDYLWCQGRVGWE